MIAALQADANSKRISSACLRISIVAAKAPTSGTNIAIIPKLNSPIGSADVIGRAGSGPTTVATGEISEPAPI